jgi:hypothetical protein
MALWPRAIVRPMRFQDLRHTSATLLLGAGVAPHFVQRILRHRDLRTTLGTYSHLDVDDLRDALTKVHAVAPSRQPEPLAIGGRNDRRRAPERHEESAPVFYPASTGNRS